MFEPILQRGREYPLAILHVFCAEWYKERGLTLAKIGGHAEGTGRRLPCEGIRPSNGGPPG
jgi:hypothetical protein